MAVALLACAVFSVQTIPAHAQDAMPAADEAQQTEAGVMAVENHWTLAEMTGDTVWLDHMLLPEYRSVGDNGAAHPKDAIVAGAAKRRGTSLDQAKLKWAAYQRDHAFGSAVVMQGNTAIVSFYDTSLGPQKGVRSSDIFVYVDGQWHALYSQHTAVRG
ncbi:nuclear transport factor 2 family protein [Dyella monticola]|uniref:Nuclear transport factor 2 family protein n=2 Tax=Dyella monticola TaxID=1927958 RepID=A0A370WWY9_9GAMM|nr:nuclear transport factor 2 family protein [Dyella monticola]